MEIPSLRPELGQELLKLVMLRESYILRLNRIFQRQGGDIDMNTVGTFDVLRELTIQIVELIEEWERAQVSFPDYKPFTWNGVNYLEKITSDLDVFASYPAVEKWFGFTLQSNPFIIPPDVIQDTQLSIPPEGFLVFGQQPEQRKAKLVKKKEKFIKSPYTTPIINDPEIFTQLSAKNKLNQKFKGKLNANDDNKDGDQGLTIPQQAALRPDSVQVPGYNPYLCYLSAETLQKIRKSSHKLYEVLEKRRQFTLLSKRKTIFDYIDEAQERPPLASDLGSSSHLLTVGEGEEGKKMSSEDMFDEYGDQDQFVANLKQHSREQYQNIDREAHTHRYQLTGPLNTSLSSQEQTSVGPRAYIWSPHEVYMQKQVQRKGGELFTITVTSTPGRLKVPVRKTRFDRMHDEIATLERESEYNSMVSEDIRSYLLRLDGEKLVVLGREAKSGETLSEEYRKEIESVLLNRHRVLDYIHHRLVMIRDIYFNFSLVAEGGDLLAYSKQRERYKLQPGQTRLLDEQMAIQAEENSIRKVQLLIRRKYGKALRQLEMNRQAAAAKRIQSFYRIYRVNCLITDYILKQRLATMVYSMYCVYKASAYKKQLQQEKLVREAVRLLQRVYRGYLGRYIVSNGYPACNSFFVISLFAERSYR